MFRHTAIALVLTLIAPLAAAQSIPLKSVEAGPRDAPPLILLHGLGDTNRSWSMVMPELAKAHRVYALDQRGHGATAAPSCCYAMADLAADVLAFMDAKKIRRAAVAGHSLGSFVAQHLAAHYPERVTKLVLLGSSDTSAGTDMLEWLWSQVAAFDERPGSAFVDEWQANPTPVDEEFMLRVKAETAMIPKHVWKGVALTLMTDDQRRFIREIRAPVLILWGENDPAFRRPQQEALQRLLPAATFKEYAKVGHNLHWEIPARVAEDMRGFLE